MPSSLSASNRVPPAQHRFWIHPELPYLEARWVVDGRNVCYAPHSHETVSIGLITGGQAIYCSGDDRYPVAADTVVVMNPGVVHACNPQGEHPWSYMMLYLHPQWVARLQGVDHFQALAVPLSTAPVVVQGLREIQQNLSAQSPHHPLRASFECRLQQRLTEVFAALGQQASSRSGQSHAPSLKGESLALRQAVTFINTRWDEKILLDELCRVSGLSATHLTRRFKAQTGLTPHAYVTNLRINRAKALLRQGEPIAETAVATGFVDQAHFQRVFKRLTAATPGAYVAPQPRQASPVIAKSATRHSTPRPQPSVD